MMNFLRQSRLWTIFMILLHLCFSDAWQKGQSSRRSWFQAVVSSGALLSTSPALAAPPIAIIAEELGYFPVTNSKGDTMYVPRRVRRDSSQQAMALAKHLQKINARVYETYWCPHSARQRELFGKQAWALIPKVECSSNGYDAQPKMCGNKIEGYPTWQVRGKFVSGERPLSILAEASGFPGKFDETLEENVPPPLGSSACK
jgi:hypothetical protein